ncbi:DUF420 domain-containing protein [Flavobacterium croceum]|uniref:DUF420 domain-containing protein n=1 Tax=Flavobacterium croceum TaxID=370975 RepID=UPI0024A8D9BB|nr:DUF420 domain-containing protein [Flavobacterium croceum]
MTTEKNYKLPIILVSILIPVVVAILFTVKLKDLGFNVEPLSFLPPIYATINAITALLLITALWAIKNKKPNLHEALMKVAILCSLLFLVMYVAYHVTSVNTYFGDANHNGILEETEKSAVGGIRMLYFFILMSHIALSIIVIPLVLITYVRALSQRFDQHRKIAKIAFPIWLYVAITGVLVYIMIAPYYA